MYSDVVASATKSRIVKIVLQTTLTFLGTYSTPRHIQTWTGKFNQTSHLKAKRGCVCACLYVSSNIIYYMTRRKKDRKVFTIKMFTNSNRDNSESKMCTIPKPLMDRFGQCESSQFTIHGDDRTSVQEVEHQLTENRMVLFLHILTGHVHHMFGLVIDQYQPLPEYFGEDAP